MVDTSRRVFLLSLPVWFVGAYYSLEERKRLVRFGEELGWQERYAPIKAELEGASEALLISDQKKRTMQYFELRYVLAPTVLNLPRKGQELPARGAPELPLLFRFEDPRALRQAIEETRERAEDLGLALHPIPIEDGLVLVKVSRVTP